jgi:hypothetical protein
VTDAAAIVAQLRRAVELLAEIDDQATTAVAAALSRLLSGEAATFEKAAGLVPGWRRRQKLRARDIALGALLKLHPDIKTSDLAEKIVAGVDSARRMHGIRSDAAEGVYRDLLLAGDTLGSKQWGRLIDQIRGHSKLEMSASPEDDLRLLEEQNVRTFNDDGDACEG